MITERDYPLISPDRLSTFLDGDEQEAEIRIRITKGDLPDTFELNYDPDDIDLLVFALANAPRLRSLARNALVFCGASSIRYSAEELADSIVEDAKTLKDIFIKSGAVDNATVFRKLS